MIHGRWRSARVADGYIDESAEIQLKLQAFQMAMGLKPKTK